MGILTVTNAKYEGNFVLLCTFNDGVTKQVDMRPLFAYPAFRELEDETQFVQFGLDDTIFWSNGTDIAPEWLYENGK